MYICMWAILQMCFGGIFIIKCVKFKETFKRVYIWGYLGFGLTFSYWGFKLVH